MICFYEDCAAREPTKGFSVPLLPWCGSSFLIFAKVTIKTELCEDTMLIFPKNLSFRCFLLAVCVKVS